MLGPYSSGLTKAIAPVTEENKIPMVEANGASRSLFTKGYKYLYPFVNKDLDAPFASTIGILFSSVIGAIALVNPAL